MRVRHHLIWLWAGGSLLAACGDPFSLFLGPVPDEPTEVTLTDLRTGPLQAASAFDMLASRPVRVDQTNAWDFLFFITEAGEPQLRPFTAVTGETRDSGLQKVAVAFDALQEAPEEGYVADAPLPIAVGDVVAMISRRDPTFAGLRCRRFGKLEVLAVDLAAGTLRFRHLINPNCEARGLIPGESGATRR